jgi:RecB family exonuclease
VLHIYPSAMARDRAITPAPGEVQFGSDHTTFPEFLQSFAAQGAPLANEVSRLLFHWRYEGDIDAAMRALRATAELRDAGVVADTLEGPIHDALRAYEIWLGAREDASGRVRAAIFRIVEGCPLPFDGIHVHAGTAVHGGRLDVLSAVAARGLPVTIEVPWDGARPVAFAWSERWLRCIESRGHGDIEVVHTPRPRAPLYGSERVEQLRLCPLVGTADIIREVVLEVDDWLRCGGRASEIAVALGPVPGLRESVRAALTSAGIASWSGDGTPLADDRVGRALTLAGELAVQDLECDRLLEWLRCLGAGLDTAVGFVSIQEIRERLRRGGYRRHRIRAVRGCLGAEPRAHAIALAIEDLVDALVLAPRAPLSAHVRRWAELLTALQLPSLDLALAGHSASAAVLRASGRSSHAARAARLLLFQLGQSGCAEEMSARDATRLLQALLSSRTSKDAGLRAGGVYVGTVSDLVGCRFEKVLLAGIEPGVFPAPAHDDPMLDDRIRAHVNRALGMRLPLQGAEHDAHARDRWLLVEALEGAAAAVLYYMVANANEHDGVSELVAELLRLGTVPEAAPVRTRLPLGAALALGEESALLAAEPRYQWATHRRGWRPAVLGAAQTGGLRRTFLETVLSPSKLDALAACRYRFFASAFLGLGRDGKTLLGADPRTEGSLAHRALHLAYTQFAVTPTIGELPVDPPAWFAGQAESLLQKLDIHPLLQPAALAAAWRVVRIQRQADQKHAASPRLLEHRFGYEDLPPVELPGPHGALRVRGTIDRVDQGPRGLHILDYKRTVRPAPEGRHLQLPLYAFAALQHLQVSDDVAILARWIALDSGVRAGDSAWPNAAAARDSIAAAVWERIETLWNGDVTPDPYKAEVCRACDFMALCRMENA